MTRRRKQLRRIAKSLAAKTPRNRVTRDQTFHIADIAAAAQRVGVVADKAVAPVAGVAVFATQGATVHAHAHANAGAPGHISAVVQTLQRAPTALGFQRPHTVVFHPHVGKCLAQRRFQERAGPIIGQTARFAGHAAANIGCGQLHQAVPQHKRPAGNHADCAQGLFADVALGAALLDHADDLQRQRV